MKRHISIEWFFAPSDFAFGELLESVEHNVLIKTRFTFFLLSHRYHRLAMVRATTTFPLIQRIK